MKILFCGDAGVSSGFAACTHAVCDHLHEIGHEVHVLGLNFYGRPDIQSKYPYSLWPCLDATDGGKDGMGITRLPVLTQRLKPDVIILLCDPWQIPNYLDYFEQWNEGREQAGAEPVPIPPVIAWIAVDAQNQHAKPLNRLDHVVTWTQFAEEELRRGGYLGTSSIVPLGVDTKIFEPKDREEARKRLFAGTGMPDDAFVIGAVGRNQPRKRLDLTLAYFSEWIHRHEIEDAYLYIHVGPTGDKGVNIESLVSWYGLGSEGRFGSRVVLGRPDIGQGIAKSAMPYVYSAFDVYFTTSQGEGWGLPALEAMACEVPVIAPDWSGLGSWATQGATLVPCSSTAPNAPLNSQAYTIGGVMDQEICIDVLQDHYENRRKNTEGRELAESLTWDSAAEKFASVLHEVMGEKPMPKLPIALYVPDAGQVEDGEVIFRGVEAQNPSPKSARAVFKLVGADISCRAVRYGSMSGPLGPGAVYLGPKGVYRGDLVFDALPAAPVELVMLDEEDRELERVPVEIDVG